MSGLRVFGLILAALGMSLGWACSSTTVAPKSDPVCEPGRSNSCTGPANCPGFQACKEDGTGFEPCECGGTGGSGGAGGGGTGGSGGGGVTPSCDNYCSIVMDSCTETNLQYLSEDFCLAACEAFDLGTAADRTGNTVGCRTYHATVAGEEDPATHCNHAGPMGAGTCGTNCESYCALMATFCPGSYNGEAECLTTCAGLPGADADIYNAQMVSGDTLQCRIYHSNNAAESPPETAAAHCPHAGAVPTLNCVSADAGP